MKRLYVIFLLVAATSWSAWAGGVNRVSGLGPRASGMSGAYTAISDDGSAFYYNVAGISQVESNFVELGTDLILPNFSFELPNGRSEESEDKIFPMPLMAGATRLSDKLVLGLGLYTPYGLGADYPNNRRHGLLYQKSLLSLTNATLALSWQVSDTLAVGAGLDVGWGQFNYNAPFHQLGQLVIDPLFMKTSGNGFGLGYRLGLLWKPSDKFSWGVGYSAPMRVAFKGDTDLNLFGLGLGDDHFKTHFTFPARIGTGIAYKPTEKLLLAFDANYYDYSGAQKMAFNFDKLPTITQQLKWQSIISLHFGGEYQIAERWFVRSGVGWQGAPVPDSTMNPIIPDAKGFDWACGLGYKRNNWSVDLAYVYAQAARKIKQELGHLAPGDYEAKVKMLSLGLSYRF